MGKGSSIGAMKGIVLSACLLLFATAAAGEIYKWVDDKGVVHYGDQPPKPGARPLEDLPGLTTYSPPPVQRPAPRSPAANTVPQPLPETLARQLEAAKGYNTLKIISPEEEGTVRSSPGVVPIFVALDPPLRKGDYFKVVLDGKPWPGRFHSTVIRLQNVDRGAHKVSVAVYGAGGRRLLQTPPRIFYLHRTIARKKG